MEHLISLIENNLELTFSFFCVVTSCISVILLSRVNMSLRKENDKLRHENTRLHNRQITGFGIRP
ncbi:hypothetical protein WAF17_10670 [Bernardetia sp. ABR2-2B]|uniref:hypothetical protein n=1 Tax=Bernardetia sp. ABR2-2B TaxID=3127472 RepID=UPI0030D16A28